MSEFRSRAHPPSTPWRARAHDQGTGFVCVQTRFIARIGRVAFVSRPQRAGEGA
jgi:hypothetical protein